MKSKHLAKIRHDYTYFLKEIAGILNLEESTIGRWVRNGVLSSIPNTRPTLVHSSQLRASFPNRKKPCRHEHMYCMKCRGVRLPSNRSIEALPAANNMMRLKANCTTCGHVMNKVVSPAKWNKDHLLYGFLKREQK